MQHSAESLLGLLNDILDFSKIEAGQLQLDPVPFDLRRLLEGIVSTMSVPATEKGLDADRASGDDLPEVLIGDDLRLRQILLNLVGNAIKFTRLGAVTIWVDRAAADGGESHAPFHRRRHRHRHPAGQIAVDLQQFRTGRQFPCPASSAAPAWACRSAAN